MRWGTFVAGLQLAILGLLLEIAAALVTYRVYEEDGPYTWRTPAGVVFMLCALRMVWDGIRACIESRRSA